MDRIDDATSPLVIELAKELLVLLNSNQLRLLLLLLR